MVQGCSGLSGLGASVVSWERKPSEPRWSRGGLRCLLSTFWLALKVMPRSLMVTRMPVRKPKKKAEMSGKAS